MAEQGWRRSQLQITDIAFRAEGSGQNMGDVVGTLAHAKVGSLGGGPPWTSGLRSKRPSTMGRSALISLTTYLDRTGSLAQRGSGCASRMGRGSSNKSRGQSFATRSRRSPERAAFALLAAGFAPSMTIAREFSTRSLAGFGSKPRASAAVTAMPSQRPSPAGLFLRWLASLQTGPPQSCSCYMPSLGPGIPFGKPRG